MSTRTDRNRAFWTTPVVGVVGGAALGIGAWLGGQPVLGLLAAAIMVAFSAGLVLLARRSETVQGLLDRRDERITTIDLRATAASGALTIVAIVVGAVAELARGHSGAPYTWLGALAGLGYLGSVIVLRVRG